MVYKNQDRGSKKGKEEKRNEENKFGTPCVEGKKNASHAISQIIKDLYVELRRVDPYGVRMASAMTNGLRDGRVTWRKIIDNIKYGDYSLGCKAYLSLYIVNNDPNAKTDLTDVSLESYEGTIKKFCEHLVVVAQLKNEKETEETKKILDIAYKKLNSMITEILIAETEAETENPV